jgi:hypothetical protein
MKLLVQNKGRDSHQVQLLPGQTVKYLVAQQFLNSASAVIQIEKSFIKETILKLEEHPN